MRRIKNNNNKEGEGEQSAQSVAHADMFCVVTGGHYVRHYWACSAPTGGPLGGVVISSQSRFTRRVPPKESMLRHIRKSPRLIKPLIFCDASTPLNAVQRTAAPGHGQCVLWPASANTERGMEIKQRRKKKKGKKKTTTQKRDGVMAV